MEHLSAPAPLPAPLRGMSGWVSLPEAARLLGISPSAVGQRVRKYRLPVLTVGQTHLVSLATLMASYAPGTVRRARLPGKEAA